VSPCGARGLFQFMPATWDFATPFSAYSSFDPTAAIAAGAWYMNQLLHQFGNDYRKALAAYNWGSGHVARAVARYGGMWETVLPLETRTYLKRILG